jgi:hypothetical protein
MRWVEMLRSCILLVLMILLVNVYYGRCLILRGLSSSRYHRLRAHLINGQRQCAASHTAQEDPRGDQSLVRPRGTGRTHRGPGPTPTRAPSPPAAAVPFSRSSWERSRESPRRSVWPNTDAGRRVRDENGGRSGNPVGTAWAQFDKADDPRGRSQRNSESKEIINRKLVESPSLRKSGRSPYIGASVSSGNRSDGHLKRTRPTGAKKSDFGIISKQPIRKHEQRRAIDQEAPPSLPTTNYKIRAPRFPVTSVQTETKLHAGNKQLAAYMARKSSQLPALPQTAYSFDRESRAAAFHNPFVTAHDTGMTKYLSKQVRSNLDGMSIQSLTQIQLSVLDAIDAGTSRMVRPLL